MLPDTVGENRGKYARILDPETDLAVDVAADPGDRCWHQAASTPGRCSPCVPFRVSAASSVYRGTAGDRRSVHSRFRARHPAGGDFASGDPWHPPPAPPSPTA